VLALVGAYLWRRSEPSRGSERETRSADVAESAATPQPLQPAGAPPVEAEPAPLATREEAPGTSRAPVRGQLVREGEDSPLRATKLLLLASEENRVSETLTTDALGAFTSTRAFPRGELRAWVKDPRTKETLARHAAPFEPQRGVWSVPVPADEAVAAARRRPVPGAPDDSKAQVRGRVVDFEGRTRYRVLVRFVPQDERLAYGGKRTNLDGEFELELEPGRYRIVGGTAGASLTIPDILLVRGMNDLGGLVLDSPGTAFLAGEVLSAEAWPMGLVRATELATGAEHVTVATSYVHAEARTRFRMEDLAPGRYRVSFHAADGREFSPAFLEVDAPAEGLSFLATGSRSRGFRFDIHGPDGSPAREARVLARLRDRWSLVAEGGEAEVPVLYEEWIVLAPDCRPARGRFSFDPQRTSLDEHGGELCEVRVDLAPGGGGVLLCLDAERIGATGLLLEGGVGVPLPGVALGLAGEKLATSEADGLLLLPVENPSRPFELVKPGWRLLERRDEEGMPVALFARQSP